MGQPAEHEVLPAAASKKPFLIIPRDRKAMPTVVRNHALSNAVI
jgi:hypothetical protein